jgi:general secretion pathway protein G
LQVRTRSASGFTLVEILVVVVIVGVLTAMATLSYQSSVEYAREGRAVADIQLMNRDFERYRLDHGSLPESLDDVYSTPRVDPWGRPYVYRVTEAAGDVCGGECDSQSPEDSSSVDNADYDLFSLGRNGKEQGPTDESDDVLRAANGAYIGAARRARLELERSSKVPRVELPTGEQTGGDSPAAPGNGP